MSLPYAVDAEQPLQPAELAVLRDQYIRELNQGHASTQTKFNFAWGLVKSKKREDMAEGVALLTEIYRSDPPRRRECLYYLSLGHYKMGNYEEAKRFNGKLSYISHQPRIYSPFSLLFLLSSQHYLWNVNLTINKHKV